MKKTTDDNALCAAIGTVAQTLHGLQQRAATGKKPIVEQIIRTGSRDVRVIKHTLDGLLDFCDYPPILSLYRQLYRHYGAFGQGASSDYVTAYHDRWDSVQP